MSLETELLLALARLVERVENRQPCCPEARYTVAVHRADCPLLGARKLLERAWSAP
jgi:hypothetical protein